MATKDESHECHRERRNAIQRKYRARMRITDTQRRVDVDQLSRVNDRLERHLVAIQRHALWCHAEEQAILEYHRLFRHGYTHSEDQDSFVRFFVAPDVWSNGLRGVDGVVAFWAAYRTTFSSLRIQVVRITSRSHTADETVLDVECSTELGMSMATLEAMFPQVLARPLLADKMLRTPLVLPVHGTFVFNAKKEVVWQASEANVVQALLRQCGNLDDVALAVSDSGIQPNAMLRGCDYAKCSKDPVKE